MSKKNIILIVGTRPNFMKAAPVYNALMKQQKFNTIIIHTGQHYDHNMSDIFFEQLELTNSKIINLNVGSASQNTQLAKIMLKLEGQFKILNPDLVLVFGDVTSTLAGALTCNKMNIKVGHVEAGNRSFDNRMPEEVNRILTDNIADYFFVSEPYALDNLRNENLIKNEILEYQNTFYVGNTMIDTLLKFKEKAIKNNYYQKINLEKDKYILMTLHRPSNIDNENNLNIIINAIVKLAENYKIFFSLHPRSYDKVFGILNDSKHNNNKHNNANNNVNNNINASIKLSKSLGYLEFMNLNINCGVLLTDSGGLQEESTILGKPCITLRENTERFITCSHGTNYLLKELDENEIVKRVNLAMNGKHKPFYINGIKYWDGKTSERIVNIINKILL